MNRILIIISLLLSWQHLGAQAFEGRVSEPEVRVHEPFELVFILTGGPAEQLKFPPLDGLEILSGPLESPQMINENGTLLQQIVYRFQAQATRPGLIRIGPAIATFADNILSTEEIELRALAQQTDLSPEEIRLRQALERSLDNNIQVVATPSRSIVYAGEPFTVQYDLWIDAQLIGQIGSISQQSTPEFEGVSAIALPVSPNRTLEIKRGKRYLRTRIRAYQLIAQSAGILRLDSVVAGMTVAIPRSGRRPQNDLELFQQQFQPAFREYQYQRVSTTPEVTVRSLPLRGRPADFSGLVGRLDGDIRLSDSILKTGQECHLRIRMSGQADYGVLSPPVLNLPPAFEWYPPVITVGEEGEELILDYSLIAREPGGYRLEMPELSFFHSGTEQYEIIGGAYTALTVQGESLQIPMSEPDGPGSDARFDDQILRLSDGTQGKWIQRWFWWILVGVWATLPGWRWWTLRRRRRLADAERRAEQAFRNRIRELLEQAERAFEEMGQEARGYAFLHRSLCLLAERSFGLSAVEQTEQGIVQAVRASHWQPDEQQEFLLLLSLSREAAYSPMPDRDGAKRLKRVRAMLSACSRKRPLPLFKRQVVWLFLGVLTGLSAQQPSEQAALLLAKQAYAEAAASYDQLHDQGGRTAELYHNWGTASYLNGDLGRAIWAYEKAIRINPHLRSTKRNLEILRREVEGYILPQPDLPVERVWKEILGDVSPSGWSWLAIVLSVLLLLLIVLSWWQPRLAQRRASLLLFGCVLLSVLLWMRHVADPQRPNGEGIILAQSILREAPEGQHELIRLSAGMKVKLGENISGWQEITVVDPASGELSGFVPAEAVDGI